MKPSTSTSTHGNSFSSIELNLPISIISQEDSTNYTNVLPSSSFQSVPAFADNQEKSYTNLNVQSLTTPNSTKIQDSSMMQPLAYYESSYTGSQV